MELSAAGKKVIGKFTHQLAPTQANKLVVNGSHRQCRLPRITAQGITSNEVLSQKRAENVMEYLVSKRAAKPCIRGRAR